MADRSAAFMELRDAYLRVVLPYAIASADDWAAREGIEGDIDLGPRLAGSMGPRRAT